MVTEARIESVERRERRVKRMERELGYYRHELRFRNPSDALHTVSLYATWNAARRLATALIGPEVSDVGVAWGIIRLVKGLPDGQERIKDATEESLRCWQADIDRLKG